MIDMLVTIAALVAVAALVLGIVAAKRNPLDVLAAGWLRLKELWREWWK